MRPAFYGVEVWHGGTTPENIEKISALVDELNKREYREYPLAKTIGSDTHGCLSRQFGPDCVPESVEDRTSFLGSLSASVSLPLDRRADYFTSLLLYWGDLSFVYRLSRFEDIRPVWSRDKNMLGKLNSEGEVVTVTEDVLSKLIKAAGDKRNTDAVLFVLDYLTTESKKRKTEEYLSMRKRK